MEKVRKKINDKTMTKHPEGLRFLFLFYCPKRTPFVDANC